LGSRTDAAQVDLIIETCMNIERIDDVGELMRLLAVAAWDLACFAAILDGQISRTGGSWRTDGSWRRNRYGRFNRRRMAR
jgi:hypothetical protein